MVHSKHFLFFYFFSILFCCSNAGEGDKINLVLHDPRESSPGTGRNILKVFPNELLDQFLMEMDLLTLTKAAASSRYMFNFRIIRNTFVEAITQFREDVKKFAQDSNIHTLINGFKMIVDACRRADNEPDLVNSLRFIFLCKFIASLRPIDNQNWQDPVNYYLSSVMSGHVDAMLHQGENENVKKMVVTLSVYDYSAYSRFLAEQVLSQLHALLYGFIILVENSGEHMQNRLPFTVFNAYNGCRQMVNSFEAINDFKKSVDKSKFTFNLKFKLNHKLRKGVQTIDDTIDSHMLFIGNLNGLLSSCIDDNYLKENIDFFEHSFVMLLCGIQDLLQFKERKNEFIRKANVNLAIFELEGKRNNFIRLLAASLRKIQTEAKTFNTSLSHQLQKIDQFINKTNIKGDDDCYLELLKPQRIENPANLTKAQLYVKEVEASVKHAIINILKPNGLKKYREALEIFRNFGSSVLFMKKIRMNLYYAYHTVIFIPEILDENLEELIDLQQLHSETFKAVQPHTLKTYQTRIFNFQNLLNDFFNKFGSDLRVSKDVNEKKENRIKQRLLLKSALLFANEVYGIDFINTVRARYPMVLEQSTDNGAAARQQILTIIKFFFASVSYNSEEIAKDFHLMCEYSMFSQSFVTEIKTLYMQNEDEVFYILHNQIDEHSPASNSMAYITQLHTLFEIYIAKKQGNEIPVPRCLLQNIFCFQTNLNLNFFEHTFIPTLWLPAYKLYSEKFSEMALKNGALKAFIDTALDWILNYFDSAGSDFHEPVGPLRVLKSIFGAIEKISDVEEAERILTPKLILKLDHVAFGCFCEYPELSGNSLQSVYKTFRLRFKFDVKSRMLGPI